MAWLLHTGGALTFNQFETEMKPGVRRQNIMNVSFIAEMESVLPAIAHLRPAGELPDGHCGLDSECGWLNPHALSLVAIPGPGLVTDGLAEVDPPGLPLGFLPPANAKEDRGWTAPLGDSVSEWASVIQRASASESLGLIQKSCILTAARRALKVGKWAQLFRDPNRPPFSKKQGEKRVLVGAVWGPVAQFTAHLDRIPILFEVLHSLARLDGPLLSTLLADGTIRADLKKPEADEIVEFYKPECRREPPPFNRARWFAKLQKHFAQMEDEGTAEDCRTVWPGVYECFERFEARAAETGDSSNAECGMNFSEGQRTDF